jgi:hypothetical protein
LIRLVQVLFPLASWKVSVYNLRLNQASFSVKVVAVGYPVLKLRIAGTPGAYKVFAQLGTEAVDGDLGALPENFREQLEPLQKSILRTTEAMRSRLSADALQQAGARPPPAAESVANPGGPALLPVKGAALNFVTGADVKTIQEIGAKLFDILFQQDIYALYKNAVTATHETAGANLSIKLFVEPPELAYIPWETLYDKRGLFHLCCSGNTLFARTATMTDEDLHIYDKPPVRILGMISAPKSFAGTPYELNSYAEQAALDRVLGSSGGDVKLRWTAAGTYKELTRRLTKGDDGERWDVLLFIGHGVEGRIVLEKDGGREYEFLDADLLKGLLSQRLGPKLVILNSCRGAQTQSRDRFASTAETLVRGGSIAAVVAMQFDISDIMGTAFSPAFFSNLMYNVSIQHAMYLTRLDLRRQGFSEWITPVLYMQNKDGMVVRPSVAVTGGS